VNSRTAAEVQRLIDAGIQCYLVGESMLRQPDVAQAVRALIGPERAAHAA
jgi:indole-3-glycerol phosphate synthase